MKKALALAVGIGLSGCSNIETATVSSTDVVAEGGDAVALIQANVLGFTMFFHLLDIVHADLEVAVNRMLVEEAKAMGAAKVDLKAFDTTPRHGVYAVLNPIHCFPIFALACWPTAFASGIAVK